MDNVVGLDLYNRTVTGGVAKTLTCQRVDVSNIPCVLIRKVDGGREENDNRIWTCDKKKRRSMDNA